MELPQDTILSFCEDCGAIQAAIVTGFNGHTRHVDIKLKYSQQNIGKLFTGRYVPTSEQRAYIASRGSRGRSF